MTPAPDSTATPSAPAGWSGRTDGSTPEHLRWHQVVVPAPDGDVGPDRVGGTGAPALAGVASVAEGEPRSTALIGFACDEGVRRNSGRVGARQGPAALRAALSSLAVLPGTGLLLDAGDVTVAEAAEGTDLEGGQAELGGRLAPLLDAHDLAVVLGGGHETAYASYLGLAASRHVGPDTRIGILNLDAHFDLREAELPSSGTPFLQIFGDEEAAGRELSYAVVGISEANNTRVLFDRAQELDVRWLTDEESQSGSLARVREFVREFAGSVHVLYLTIDLDVLPAAVAPGVSAPAGFGVPYDVIHACVDEATASGKLALVDVVELNPGLDQDQRTARAAARLLHTAVSRHRPLP